LCGPGKCGRVKSGVCGGGISPLLHMYSFDCQDKPFDYKSKGVALPSGVASGIEIGDQRAVETQRSGVQSRGGQYRQKERPTPATLAYCQDDKNLQSSLEPGIFAASAPIKPALRSLLGTSTVAAALRRGGSVSFADSVDVAVEGAPTVDEEWMPTPTSPAGSSSASEAIIEGCIGGTCVVGEDDEVAGDGGNKGVDVGTAQPLLAHPIADSPQPVPTPPPPLAAKVLEVITSVSPLIAPERTPEPDVVDAGIGGLVANAHKHNTLARKVANGAPSSNSSSSRRTKGTREKEGERMPSDQDSTNACVLPRATKLTAPPRILQRDRPLPMLEPAEAVVSCKCPSPPPSPVEATTVAPEFSSGAPN
jgi:hypothetical protein